MSEAGKVGAGATERPWKLVPVEPTEEMLAAFLPRSSPRGLTITLSDDIVQAFIQHTRNDYAAMLAAAPEPPASYHPERDAEKFECAANNGPPDHFDCNWPGCGCDPYADKVIAAIHESGHTIVTAGVLAERDALLVEMEKALRKISAQCDLPMGASRSKRLNVIDAIADTALTRLRATQAKAST